MLIKNSSRILKRYSYPYFRIRGIKNSKWYLDRMEYLMAIIRSYNIMDNTSNIIYVPVYTLRWESRMNLAKDYYGSIYFYLTVEGQIYFLPTDVMVMRGYRYFGGFRDIRACRSYILDIIRDWEWSDYGSYFNEVDIAMLYIGGNDGMVSYSEDEANGMVLYRGHIEIMFRGLLDTGIRDIDMAEMAI